MLQIDDYLKQPTGSLKERFTCRACPKPENIPRLFVTSSEALCTSMDLAEDLEERESYESDKYCVYFLSNGNKIIIKEAVEKQFVTQPNLQN